MKITNPSVTLKDGLWYGYTANSEAALVKISNQEEVLQMWYCDCMADGPDPGGGKDMSFEYFIKTLKPDTVYKLDGYVMEVSEQRRYLNHMTNTWSKWYDVEPIWAKQSMIETMRVATISPIQKQEPQAASFPDFEKYSAYKESKTVATSGTKYAAPDNQEELWRAVSKEINEEGLWQYEDWDGFKLTEKGIHYLKEQFTITRKP